MRALWVFATRSTLQTHLMSHTTSVTTFVRGAAIVGRAFVRRTTAAKERPAKRFAPTLLLALPFLVTLVPEVVDRHPTIDVTVSRRVVDRDTAHVNAE